MLQVANSRLEATLPEYKHVVGKWKTASTSASGKQNIILQAAITRKLVSRKPGGPTEEKPCSPHQSKPT